MLNSEIVTDVILESSRNQVVKYLENMIRVEIQLNDLEDDISLLAQLVVDFLPFSSYYFVVEFQRRAPQGITRIKVIIPIGK